MILLLVLSVGGIVVLYWVEKGKAAGEGTDAQTVQEGVTDRNVTLYFRSPVGRGKALLRFEERSMLAPSDQRQFLLKLVEELKSGSRTGGFDTIPREANLTDVYIVGKQVVLDFSKELSTRHPGGELEELSTLYSIVNTVLRNSPGFDTVHILVEGRRRETLAGGIAMDKGFIFADDLVESTTTKAGN